MNQKAMEKKKREKIKKNKWNQNRIEKKRKRRKAVILGKKRRKVIYRRDHGYYGLFDLYYYGYIRDCSPTPIAGDLLSSTTDCTSDSISISGSGSIKNWKHEYEWGYE